jgi:hypothetical protein
MDLDFFVVLGVAAALIFIGYLLHTGISFEPEFDHLVQRSAGADLHPMAFLAAFPTSVIVIAWIIVNLDLVFDFLLGVLPYSIHAPTIRIEPDQQLDEILQDTQNIRDGMFDPPESPHKDIFEEVPKNQVSFWLEAWGSLFGQWTEI